MVQEVGGATGSDEGKAGKEEVSHIDPGEGSPRATEGHGEAPGWPEPLLGFPRRR